jgi:hypothetical protein
MEAQVFAVVACNRKARVRITLSQRAEELGRGLDGDGKGHLPLVHERPEVIPVSCEEM